MGEADTSTNKAGGCAGGILLALLDFLEIPKSRGSGLCSGSWWEDFMLECSLSVVFTFGNHSSA